MRAALLISVFVVVGVYAADDYVDSHACVKCHANQARAYRQTQAQAAIRFCEALFGNEYASLMSRAVENALTGERKSSRA